MEQKRTLWILIAAGIFLCIVFGAAFFMTRAAGNKTEETTAISLKDSDDIWIAPYKEDEKKPAAEKIDSERPNQIAKIDSSETAPSSEVKDEKADAASSGKSSLTDGLEYPEEGKSTAKLDSKTESDSKAETSAPKDVTIASSDGRITTTFDLSSGSEGSGVVTAQNKAAEKAMKNADTKRGEMAKTLDESTTKKKTTTATKPAETKTSVASVKPATTTTKTTASKGTKTDVSASKKEVTSSKIPDRYWVQAASYSSKKKADEARAILDKNMVQCEVFTFEMDGTLYYRVRVGPYTTKTEAAYWKEQVDALDQFADAGTYIVNSSAPIAKK